MTWNVEAGFPPPGENGSTAAFVVLVARGRLCRFSLGNRSAFIRFFSIARSPGDAPACSSGRSWSCFNTGLRVCPSGPCILPSEAFFGSIGNPKVFDMKEMKSKARRRGHMLGSITTIDQDFNWMEPTEIRWSGDGEWRGVRWTLRRGVIWALRKGNRRLKR